ncbi:hypothetical protein HZH66_014989 [Vespula vulgaris]|uniref:Uncharacterized protein n=1 Tax=Vespula vulgaris TaxID=7454 RepID=A0A834MMN3_VESVU|nr:hypothetical protein HZH66_014989 [Vespula vulgaris]
MPKRPPQTVAQEGNYYTIELFSKVRQNSSKIALYHILILPCCHSKCSYIESRVTVIRTLTVESPLAHGFPDAATFLRYDLG